MSTGRRLRDEEREVIGAVLSGKPSNAKLLSDLDGCMVEDMQDGGMGSIRFLTSSERRRFGGIQRITIAT